MIRRPPRAPRTYTLCPYTALFRSRACRPTQKRDERVGRLWQRNAGEPPAQTNKRRHHDGVAEQIGRAHVSTPVTNAQLVCRLLIEKKKTQHKKDAKLHSHKNITLEY